MPQCLGGGTEIKMKSFVVSIIIAACIIGGSIAYSVYLDNLSEEMCVCSNEIKELINNEDYNEACRRTEELSGFLEKKKLSLASTMDHGSLDNIEKNIAELRVYALCGQKSDALAKCELLNVLFEHLPKSYRLNLENIL